MMRQWNTDDTDWMDNNGFLKIIFVLIRPIRVTRVLLAFFFCFPSFAQEVIPPMDIPLYLSGNFGELRSNHFHSGIDFKTQGIEGIPVKAVKEGFISRISVSPYGYGRAVYVNHPNGLTSVYGHLSKFSPAIESAVRDSQYHKESFTVNLYFKEYEFPVKRGEIIAYSGNTGSSGGPHLHFEFRDTESEEVIDPLLYYRDKIKDARPPDLQGIMIFPQPGKGIVNNSTENQGIKIIKDKSGKQVLAKPIYAWGNIGIGVKSYDKMNETSNIYGVREILLKVDNAEIFHSLIDRFSFNDTRYLNSFIDWKDWTENRSFYMKSFIEPGNRLHFYQASCNGIISVFEERDYLCEYILKDIYGNMTSFYFTLTGKNTMIPDDKREGILLRYNLDNRIHKTGFQLDIPQGNLYTNILFNLNVVAGYNEFSPLYEIEEHAPLHSYCPITLNISNDVYPDKSKYGIISIHKDRIAWISGKYSDGKITGEIRELRDFAVSIDTIPPVITPVRPTKWTSDKHIAFKITDDLSGIAEWKGTLNNEFVLFEYDAKTNSLFCDFDPKRMKRGNLHLNLLVKDGVGNIAEFSRDIQW